MKQTEHILIIGAGLVGSLLAVYLRKRGYRVSVYERRADMRKEQMSAGRSINLALSDRGIRALREVGLMDQIDPIAIPMHGRQMHPIQGDEVYQPYGKSGQFINAVSRGLLNQTLLDAAEEAGAVIHFQHKCLHVDLAHNQVQFETRDGSVLRVQADRIIASDGAFSSGRLSHQLQHNRFQFQQYYIDYGYKELHIPPTAQGDYALAKHALHIWPRGNYMMIALPNTDGSFTCTLFFPFEGTPSFASLQSHEDVLTFFQTQFPDAVPWMPTLVEDFFANPTSSLVTIKCAPWTRGDRFALIGDAAHAIVPFFGQGMNCGFEDCAVLNQLLDQHEDDWSKALAEYDALRKPDGDAIAELALNNFVEMRDRVADPAFLLQKKIEAWFAEKHPTKWIPAYAQVTFSPQIRYSEALRNGQRQERIMQQIMQLPEIESQWQTEVIEQRMLELLETIPA